METLRQRLSIFILCVAFLATSAFAQSTLSQIQDTVYSSDGSLFDGTVVITWTGAQSGNSPAPYNTSVQIYNGALSVLLVPSTTASPAGYYQAVYSSSDGLVTWSETWEVPPSSTPLTLDEIRVSDPTGGTGGGSSSDGSPISISQVTGLNSYLTALNSSLTSLTTLVDALSATITNMSGTISNLSAQVSAVTSGVSNAAFSDGEGPGGSINGTNATFTLAQTPANAASLMLFRNGLVQTNGLDYTLSGQTITFLGHDIPQSGDTLIAYYRLPGTGPSTTFIDDEIPQGTIDGNNVTFTLSATPSPATSLKLFKNGELMIQNADYTVNGAKITFADEDATPKTGDSLVAYYRVTTGS